MQRWQNVITEGGGSARRRRLRRAVMVGTLAAISLAVTGCVRRTLTINTDPQGARVFLNDRQVGTSPVTVNFVYYGDYDIILRKEGYETLKTHHHMQAPWYQVPPLDLLAETMVPATIKDHYEVSFELSPAEPIDHEELVEQAVEFRERALFESE